VSTSVNKSELIDAVATDAGVSKRVAAQVLNSTLKSITDFLRQRRDVILIGFGGFKVKDRDSRMVRNPRTGEMIEVPPTTVVGFKVGTELRNAVKEAALVDAE